MLQVKFDKLANVNNKNVSIWTVRQSCSSGGFVFVGQITCKVKASVEQAYREALSAYNNL